MTAVETARRARNGDLPDWVRALAEECDRTSQRAAAARIGYSAAAVNQVLAGKYRAPETRVELAVRAALLAAEVCCPVAGVIPAARCLENQRLPWASTNPQRVALYRACRNGCPHSRL